MKYHCLTSFNQAHECTQAQQNEHDMINTGAQHVDSDGVKHNWQCKYLLALDSCFNLKIKSIKSNFYHKTISNKLGKKAFNGKTVYLKIKLKSCFCILTILLLMTTMKEGDHVKAYNNLSLDLFLFIIYILPLGYIFCKQSAVSLLCR